MDVYVCKVWKGNQWEGHWKNVAVRWRLEDAQEWMLADIKNREYDVFWMEMGT